MLRTRKCTDDEEDCLNILYRVQIAQQKRMDRLYPSTCMHFDG